MPKRVGVIGLGYVGLTLTAAMARKGYTVVGVDASAPVVEALSGGRVHLYEPGVAEAFAEFLGERVHVADRLPDEPLDAAILSVSTPVDLTTGTPRLENLAAAAEEVARRCHPDTLVVVRSTVPIGTSRDVVLPALSARWARPRLVMAPERTIQGQALRELVELPQVIGGLDEESLRAGVDLFTGLANQIVPVSSLEAAEMVKLSNNCHTDLIYAFGNELALIAEQHGLDPLEVIRAANLDYPRPDLAKPGYVGGGCLTKDPYLMLAGTWREPYLVGRARALNESMPAHVAERVVELVRQEFGRTEGIRLSVLGWAYKGWPATDDMRGTPIADMMPVFREAGLAVRGHDPLVSDEVIRRYGGEPVSLDKAFADADAVILINDHPDYREIEVAGKLAGSGVRVLFDSWRILDEAAVTGCGVRYAGIGYQARERAS
ncbi:nucleotide sugar dehydrogenase [Nonomuraea sp. MCN248]|uniref:Nucleotide sugar dehydrogenase n=1 Tax=Nonomuraea corallina TaxID=2989783 RepID=A0ABT4SKD7_9ACTN|nr:nucleotide sugar dehydrogenase [Nonomuraea corallina]MDA0637455.1 nucleotide sugar dehydrogenase [Nonomuraea corallina]